jgi:hypothetical protein
MLNNSPLARPGAYSEHNRMVSPFDIKIKPYSPDMMESGGVPRFGSDLPNEINPEASEKGFEKPSASGGEGVRLMTFSEEAGGPEINSTDDLNFVERFDILTLQKKRTSAQMCLCCRKENRYTIFPYDKFGNASDTPIYETLEYAEPLSNCCADVDCRSLYMTMHSVKPDFSVNEKTFLSFHKESAFHCCTICEEFYRVNAHCGEKAVNVFKMQVSKCHLIPTYLIYDSENKLQFIVKGTARNLFMFPMLGCHTFRKMSFDVLSINGTRLTTVAHSGDALTIMFPPKFTNKQKNLLTIACIIIFQRHL